jgi:predicted transcriptional regulator
MINWKDYFEDINTFYIWGTCSLNQVYNEKNRTKSEEIENLVLDKYLQKILETSGSGLNVMSISEMTQIPRATVIRKVKYLENEKLIKSNSKKQYYLSDFTPFKISPKIKENFKIKSTFVANVFNLIIM